jgi:hypothetical protein
VRNKNPRSNGNRYREDEKEFWTQLSLISKPGFDLGSTLFEGATDRTVKNWLDEYAGKGFLSVSQLRSIENENVEEDA